MKNRLFNFIIILPILICALVFLGGWTTDQPVTNTINLDELMVKWKASDNWVLEESQTSYLLNENKEAVKPDHAKSITAIIERNGSITKQTKNLPGYQTMSICVFDGDNCTGYSYRRSEADSVWDTSFCSPNPSIVKYSIEKFCEKLITNDVEPTIRRAATSIKEEEGIYYFEGFDNLSKLFSDVDTDMPGDICISFSYKLTFGTSIVEKP